MHPLILALHSLLRWVVIIVGLVACARGLTGWMGAKPWTSADNRAGAFFVIGLDIQLVLGLLLYFVVSPVTTMAFENMEPAMQNSAIRFFLVEHFMLMIVGIALAHVGRALGRRAKADAGKHRLGAIFFGLALLVMLLAIPWPGMPWGRPLLPI